MVHVAYEQQGQGPKKGETAQKAAKWNGTGQLRDSEREWVSSIGGNRLAMAAILLCFDMAEGKGGAVVQRTVQSVL